jgi:acetyltransferase-like isoleucine patch superfamily enzyme
MTFRHWGNPAKISIHPTAVYNQDLFCNSVSGNIIISQYVFFGHEVFLLTGSHDYTKFNSERINAIPETGYDIIIDEGVWVGSRTTIIGPCHIGKHAVIGAGSVVTKNVDEYTVVAGNPAKFIKGILK